MNKTFTEVLGTYQVPAWALPALINGDYSGLSDSEEQSIEDFASDFNEAFNCGDELRTLEPCGADFQPHR
jgi:hypothetical protein